MSNDAIIIVGPAGCGKTHNAQRLASLFRVANVVEEDRWLLSKVVEPDTLYLCTEVPKWAVGKAYVIPFGAAMRALPSLPVDEPHHPRGFARIEGDEIVIRVPLAAVPQAFQYRFDNEGMDPDDRVQLTDIDEFVDDLVLQLNAEDEIGETAITKLLDEAMDAAIDGGCEGVSFGQA